MSSRSVGLTWPIGVLTITTAYVAVYYPTLQKLSAYWAANETYSFGFLVPVITAYLLWLRRDRLRQVPWSPSLVAGGLALGAGLFTLVLGRLSSINLLEEVSLPISIYGLVLLVFGWRLTQSMTFPLLYLLAMIPFWEFLTGRLHLPFQLYSAAMGVEALRLFGIPVLRDGVFIELPNITLEVAQLCSGVNNLVAVLCLGVPLTHFYVKGWLKRGFILSMAVLIALLSNGVRVATVCFFAYYGIRGADGDIHGPFALLRTLLISGIGFIALFWLVGKFADRRETPFHSSTSDTSGSAHWLRHRAAWLLAIALLTGTLFYERVRADTPVPLRAHLVAFPNEIANWHFDRVGSVLPSLASQANFDQWTSRVYTSPNGTELELLLGYYERQQQGKELGGFELAPVTPADFRATTSGVGRARVKDGLTTVKGRTYHLTYWYLVDGRAVTEGYQAKLWTTLNSITTGRSNGGLLVVARPLGPGETIEASREQILSFVGEVMRASTVYFPQG
jgi:EpsI family protein